MPTIKDNKTVTKIVVNIPKFERLLSKSIEEISKMTRIASMS